MWRTLVIDIYSKHNKKIISSFFFISCFFPIFDGKLQIVTFHLLIDESSAREIRSADRFGIFEVRTATADNIMFDNENSVSLSKNSTPGLLM